MENIAVITTVFNRKNVTINGLNSLYSAINRLGLDYHFDVYLTDDGSTDGTADAVSELFPHVHILCGDGNLYWSGGMRKAWRAAIDSGVNYDFFLWFNDDAELYEDSLETMFESFYHYGEKSIISGAFVDRSGNVSYGGRDKNMNWIVPGYEKQIFFMNGNFVLIPKYVFETLGNIGKIYTHSLGDWDYGLKAGNYGFKVLVSRKYVGITNRHDTTPVYWSNSYSLKNRLHSLYAFPSSPLIVFHFYKQYFGLLKGVIKLIIIHLFAIFPQLYELRHR
ncbi:MAG: glycosyltransferase family 2 protein [Bacteroidales bacterium]|nr:glycosyltransferase family 2 protein [Bacteroidales bacterium]